MEPAASALGVLGTVVFTGWPPSGGHVERANPHAGPGTGQGGRGVAGVSMRHELHGWALCPTSTPLPRLLLVSKADGEPGSILWPDMKEPRKWTNWVKAQMFLLFTEGLRVQNHQIRWLEMFGESRDSSLANSGLQQLD